MKENKQTLLNLIANIFSFSISFGITFFLTPFLINNLGKEVYSFYPIANTIISYISIFVGALNSIASRFVTISIKKNDYDNANLYFSSTLLMNIILTSILLPFAILIVVFLDSFLNIPINSIAAIKLLFSLIFVSTFITILSGVFGIATFSKNRIDLRSIREIVASIVKASLIIVLFVSLPSQIWFIGIAAVATSFLNLVIQYFYTKKLLPELKISLRNTSIQHSFELLKSSIWNSVFSLGGVMLSSMCLILINKIYGAEIGGTYSIANNVPLFISGIISTICSVFFPLITYKYAESNKENLKTQIIFSQKVVGAIGCAVISVFSAFSLDFFKLWMPNENNYTLFYLTLLLMIPMIFSSTNWCLSNVNVAANKVKIPGIVTCGLGLLNIGAGIVFSVSFSLEFYWIPIISCILQLILYEVFLPLYCSKILKFKASTFLSTSLKNVLLVIGVFSLCFLFRHFYCIDSWFEFILFGLIFGIVSLVVFFLGNFGSKIVNFLKRKM